VTGRPPAGVAVAAQQTGEARDPDQPDNLWAPLDGVGGRDFGSHGGFADRSHARSPQAWASRHHGAVLSTLGLAAVAGLAGRARRAK
jgi:hypothetical protein